MNYIEETLKYYSTHKNDFINSTVNVDFTQTQDKFLSYLKPHSTILDFGCGSGRDAKYFLSKGYTVFATDGSKVMCEYASLLTGVNVAQMDFLELTDTEKYDGIWACSSILHLSKGDLEKVLQKIETALKNEGIFYTSFKYGDFEGVRNGRFFTDLTEKSFTELLYSSTNLKISEYWITSDVRPGRESEKWLNVICTKI